MAAGGMEITKSTAASMTLIASRRRQNAVSARIPRKTLTAMAATGGDTPAALTAMAPGTQCASLPGSATAAGDDHIRCETQTLLIQ